MPVRKTISLSKNTLIAMFRVLAEILDEDTELAEKLRSELVKRIETPERTHAKITGFFDKDTPIEDIVRQLEAKTLKELVSIVDGYALDHTKTIRKLKDKQRIIKFIIERRNALLNRYEGF